MKKTTSKPTYKIRTYKGLPVIDSNKDLEISISKADVLKAKKKDPNNCAAAVAVKRIYGNEVEVHISRTYIKKNKHWVRFLTPESLSREIISFDRSGIFDSGDYTIKAPGPGQKLGAFRGSGGSGKKAVCKQHRTRNIRIDAEKAKS